MTAHLLDRLKRFLLLCSICLCLGAAHASSDHGGGGGGGGESMRFTVNVQSPQGGRYLQIEVMFETATPEANHEIATLRPRVQHQLILLLSSQKVEHLLTVAGKKDLMEEIAETVNEVIEANHKTGVKGVLFTSFIIQ